MFDIQVIANDDNQTPFPNPERALKEPNGLIAAGGNLSPERLLMAYRKGIFPWFGEDEPILWWTPNPRCVIFTEQFKPNRSLRKVINRQAFKIRINTAFEEVINACAAPRQNQSSTWITQAMRDAYIKLNQLGYAHSIETWQNSKLVGGLYGIAIDAVFFGESMFSRASNASKVALASLASSGSYKLIDCQLESVHLHKMGAKMVHRQEFQQLLSELIEQSQLNKKT